MIKTLLSTANAHLILDVSDRYAITYHRISFSLDLLDLETAEKYATSLVDHISFVREAGKTLGVPENQLAEHDISKWSHEEFPYYALNFHGSLSPVDGEKRAISDLFVTAWLHHIHNNPHHWQHWVFSDGYTPQNSSVENGVVQMPDMYALEMIADWMGASKAYTGSWDMTEWLNKNWNKIKLHSQTRKFVSDVLSGHGYYLPI